MVKTEEIYRINYKHVPVIEFETDLDDKITSVEIIPSFFFPNKEEIEKLKSMTMADLRTMLLKSVQLSDIKLLKYTFRLDGKNTEISCRAILV